jgi:hypothetical protein
MEANIRSELKTIQKEMDSNQGKAEVCHRDMEAKMDVHQEGMEAKMDGWLGEMKV